MADCIARDRANPHASSCFVRPTPCPNPPVTRFTITVVMRTDKRTDRTEPNLHTQSIVDKRTRFVVRFDFNTQPQKQHEFKARITSAKCEYPNRSKNFQAFYILSLSPKEKPLGQSTVIDLIKSIFILLQRIYTYFWLFM